MEKYDDKRKNIIYSYVHSYELQRYYYEAFYQFAYREMIFILKDHALVEDIIQEAFLKATRKRMQLKDLENGKKWVKRIIRNQMIDSLKSKKYRSLTGIDAGLFENDTVLEIAADISVETTIEKTFRNKALQEAIKELKHDYQVVLLKYYIDEKSHKELAYELGIGEQVIAQRLVRARKALLIKFLNKWGDEEGEV